MEHIAFAAALSKLIVQEGRPRLHVLNPHCQPCGDADLPRLEIQWQPGLFESFAPYPPRGAEFFVGLVGAAAGFVRALSGGSVLRIQRRQFFKCGQFLFRRGQPGHHRAAAARKLVVQHRSLVLSLFDLRFQQSQLVLALLKLLIIGTLHSVAQVRIPPAAITSPTPHTDQ